MAYIDTFNTLVREIKEVGWQSFVVNHLGEINQIKFHLYEDKYMDSVNYTIVRKLARMLTEGEE